jgi:hypothetical protein
MDEVFEPSPIVGLWLDLRRSKSPTMMKLLATNGS